MGVSVAVAEGVAGEGVTVAVGNLVRVEVGVIVKVGVKLGEGVRLGNGVRVAVGDAFRPAIPMNRNGKLQLSVIRL